jgi:hypothetical protein
MVPCTLVLRFFLKPSEIYRPWIQVQNFFKSFKRERSKFFDAYECDLVVQIASLALFDKFIVYFAGEHDHADSLLVVKRIR